MVMHLVVPQSLLAEHLQVVVKAIPTKSNIAASEGFLLECDGEKLILSASNLEMGLQTQFSVIQTDVGKVVLPAKVVEIIRRLPGDTVHIKVNLENYVTDISSGNAEFQVMGLSSEEFPAFPQFDVGEAQYFFHIKAGDLRRALRQTLFAVSHDEGKPAFTGILFTLRSESLSLSSSDTFRLANTMCPVQNEGATGVFLVPAKNLQELIRIFTRDEDIISAMVVQNQLLLVSGDIKFSSRLLDENFPNVERVIPKEFTGKANINTTIFMQALERASLLSEGTNHVVRLSIGPDVMVVRASSKFGKIQEKVPLVLEGEGLEIALNVRFIIDMLKVNEGEQCLIEITGQNKPCILKDSLSPHYLYLVLPIKI